MEEEEGKLEEERNIIKRQRPRGLKSLKSKVRGQSRNQCVGLGEWILKGKILCKRGPGILMPTLKSTTFQLCRQGQII